MKKTLAMALLLGSLGLASAATTNLFVETWGTYDGGGAVLGNGNINQVGWTAVAGSQTAAPYLGIYVATGANNPATGEPLPPNTVYFTDLLDAGVQTLPGMFYTITGQDLPDGTNTAFADIDPTQYTNLTFSIQVRGAATDTNFFAIRVGTDWYVSTNQLPGSGALAYPQFTNAVVPYTNAASAWRTLTIGTTNVTIGAAPGVNLNGLITGVGIVELPTFGGFNYNRLTISATIPGDDQPPAIPPTITSAPINQTASIGGGASFLALASGTPPLTFIWLTNGVAVAEGIKYSGTSNNILTISNVTADDAALTYSLIVTNAGGGATNSGFTLTAEAVPDDILYSETYPYVGPNGNLPLAGVGWQTVGQGPAGIFSSGPGLGIVFSYSADPTTNLYFVTPASDAGASGLPFEPINPDTLPAVTLQASIAPGNGDALNPTNVVAYWAVQMQDGSWYISSQRIPVQITTINNYQPYQLAFSRAATNWNTLTLDANFAVIGSQAGVDLAGNITGAGLVMVHEGALGGGDFNFDNFLISTNAIAVTPPVIGVNGAPYSQTVQAGGGVSFGVSATGPEPFTYGWTLNGAPLVNGPRISGADTPRITIASLTAADSGAVVAYVTNSAGFDQSDLYVGTSLTVENPPVGHIYSETFPFVGPIAGNYPITDAGWTEAVANTPNTLYQNLGSDGAVFAFRNVPDTTAYYTSTATDTNQAGLPFPNIKLSAYSDLNIAVDIAPSFAAANVTAYIAVQVNGIWYVTANALPVPTTDSGTFVTYNTPFNAAAANWRNLTITSSGATIGSAITSNLSGIMTGAGLVFVTINTGGTHNFDNLVITGTGVGGINVGPTPGGGFNITWVGNPAVNLQSATNLVSPDWQDVPNSAGLYSFPIQPTGPQNYFRLEGP
jgi:hypothetical protein